MNNVATLLVVVAMSAGSLAAAPRCLVRFAFDDKARMQGLLFAEDAATPSPDQLARLHAWVEVLVEGQAQYTLLGSHSGGGPLGSVWNGDNDLVILCERAARRVGFGAVRAVALGQAGGWWVYGVSYAKWRAALRPKRIRVSRKTTVELGVATVRIDGKRLGEFRETGGE